MKVRTAGQTEKNEQHEYFVHQAPLPSRSRGNHRRLPAVRRRGLLFPFYFLIGHDFPVTIETFEKAFNRLSNEINFRNNLIFLAVIDIRGKVAAPGAYV